MIFGDNLDGVIGLVVVTLAGDAEKLAPVIDVGSSVSVHGAMNDDRVDSGLVRAGDLPDVSRVARVGETFVMNNDVVPFPPSLMTFHSAVMP